MLFYWLNFTCMCEVFVTTMAPPVCIAPGCWPTLLEPKQPVHMSTTITIPPIINNTERMIIASPASHSDVLQYTQPKTIHLQKHPKKTAAVVISHLRISSNGELREIQGLCSKMTPLDSEEGVKVSNWKIVSGHDLL